MNLRHELSHLILLALFFVPLTGQATDSIPDLRTTVATQLREDGVLGREVNVFTVSCWEGNCKVTRLVFNRCFEIENLSINDQILVVSSIDSRDGSLSVRREGNAIWFEEFSIDIGGRATETLRLEFDSNQPDPGYWTVLTNFSGSYTKQSELAGRVITVEYLPLEGEWVEVKPACEIKFRGLVR